MSRSIPPRRAHFEVVRAAPAIAGRAARFRRRRLPWLAIAAVLAAAGVVAAATLTVGHKRDTTTLFAERYEVGESFVVEATGFRASHTAFDPSGVDGSPVELMSTSPEVRTKLTQDQWVYAFTLKEAAANAVTSGEYTIELFVDEIRKGAIHVRQETVEAESVESVRVSFGIGPSLSTSALYLVVVKPFVPEGDTVSYVLKTKSDLTWVGSGGDIEGEVNPALSVKAGDTLRLTAMNDDGLTHDIGIRTEANTVVTPPGWSADVEIIGDEATISWKAESGTYTYACKYHATTMKGSITVT